MDVLFTVEINNVPEYTEEWIVARVEPGTRLLWYWGSWDDEAQAHEIAKFIDGVVVRRIEHG